MIVKSHMKSTAGSVLLRKALAMDSPMLMMWFIKACPIDDFTVLQREGIT